MHHHFRHHHHHNHLHRHHHHRPPEIGGSSSRLPCVERHLIHGTNKAPKLTREDFISKMPDDVLTNILDRLQLLDAVRTSILARNWRFNWTLLSQLVFDENIYYYLTRTNGESQLARIISRLLLHIKGIITKFTLCVRDELDDVDIANWFLLLSEKRVNDLTIRKMGSLHQLKLPSHLFSCLELKRLKLNNCCLSPPPTFHGFPNLLSLELHLIRFETSDLGGFLTCCPSLEILISTCILKAVWIAKFENIKILSMGLSMLDHGITMRFHSSNTIFELLDSLPKLHELELYFHMCKLTEGGVNNKRLSTGFPSLKALKLSNICLDDGMKLSCAFELIKSFPNLQTLEITASRLRDGVSAPVDCNATGLLQLRSVMFEYWKGSENELCLLKYLLACSPFLKKIVIRSTFGSMITSDERLEFAGKLLQVHRASPVVDIDLS